MTAYNAFTHQRDAVRLTQRADVLLDAIGWEPHTDPSVLNASTQISVRFKNFGPTRASNVRITLNLYPPEELEIVKGPHDDDALPPVNIGTGDTTTPRLSKLGVRYTPETITKLSKGHIKLIVAGSVTYEDVFGITHHTDVRAIYYGEGSGGFVVQPNSQAT